jgi:hypothetical protein
MTLFSNLFYKNIRHLPLQIYGKFDSRPKNVDLPDEEIMEEDSSSSYSCFFICSEKGILRGQDIT